MPALAPFQGLTAPMTAFCTPPKTVPTPLPTRCSCERAYGHLYKRSFVNALCDCKSGLERREGGPNASLSAPSRPAGRRFCPIYRQCFPQGRPTLPTGRHPHPCGEWADRTSRRVGVWRPLCGLLYPRSLRVVDSCVLECGFSYTAGRFSLQVTSTGYRVIPWTLMHLITIGH
jgi:hypothetical protein